MPDANFKSPASQSYLPCQVLSCSGGEQRSAISDRHKDRKANQTKFSPPLHALKPDPRGWVERVGPKISYCYCKNEPRGCQWYVEGEKSRFLLPIRGVNPLTNVLTVHGNTRAATALRLNWKDNRELVVFFCQLHFSAAQTVEMKLCESCWLKQIETLPKRGKSSSRNL